MPLTYIRQRDWNLIETFHPKGLELHHVGRGLEETTKLANTASEKSAELLRQLQA